MYFIPSSDKPYGDPVKIPLGPNGEVPIQESDLDETELSETPGDL